MAMFSASAQQIDLPQALGFAAGAQSTTSTVEGVAKAKHADPVYVWLAYALVASAAVIAAILLAVLDPELPAPVAGMNVFASLYVAAQAIERILEPAREWLGDPLNKVEAPSEDEAKDASTTGSEATNKGASKSDLRHVRSLAIQTARTKTAEAAASGQEVEKQAAEKAANVAAQAQAAVEQERSNSAVIMWALASFLGIIIAAWVGLGVLHLVGVKDAPRWVDVVVTGLAIGGGTKPLHDLIGNLQAAKDNKSDPAAVKQT